VKKLRWWAALGAVVVASVALTACGSGGGSGDSGSIRLINATQSHPSLDLLANAAVATTGTALNTVSSYASVGTGSPVLQINDTGSSTAVATTSTTVTGNQHYALLAYESGGAVKTAVLTEDFATPTAGTGQFRIFDTAFDAGAIDVYITTPTADLNSASPAVSFTAQIFVQSSLLLSYTPGTYRVRVTTSGSKTQVLLDTSATLGDQQVITVALAPASGGILLDGSVLVQQGAYTAARNTNARVRLASSVTASATVTASAGAVAIDSGTSPSFGAYVTVPAANALNISVNGNSVAAPATALAAGGDYTLMVYGAGAPTNAATAVLLADDNRLPTSTGTTKVRLINGQTGAGAASGLTLAADLSPIASNILPGSASSYGTIPVTATTAVELDVSAGGSSTPVYTRTGTLNVPAVYTLFMVGDSSPTATGILRRDR